MGEIKGYGVSIRTTPIDKQNTVAYQELSMIGLFGDDAVIDLVRPEYADRPELSNLIQTLSVGDRIDLYSVDTLLMGRNNNAVQYYSEILEKGIGLLVFDFSGAVAKLSPFSTLRFGHTKDGEEFLVLKDAEEQSALIPLFASYSETAKPQKNSGGLKIEQRLNFTEQFKEIYFAYESYQIDLPTTLSLLKEYCGIEHKNTFWLMAKDFENSLWYSEELANQSIDILELPKRCGKLPDEYFEIVSYMNEYLSNIPKEKDRVELAMENLNMVGSYEIFLRWQLLADKKPKPRKPVPYNFNVEEFKNRYRTV